MEKAISTTQIIWTNNKYGHDYNQEGRYMQQEKRLKTPAQPSGEVWEGFLTKGASVFKIENFSFLKIQSTPILPQFLLARIREGFGKMVLIL